MTASVDEGSSPPGHLSWVSDWRLRAALGSSGLWHDLLLQLRVVSQEERACLLLSLHPSEP